MILPDNIQLVLASDTEDLSRNNGENGASGNSPLSAHATLFIDIDCPYLDGHFDKRAVLPGVVHIGWAIALAERAFDIRFSFHALKMMKCTQLVLPPVELNMSLEYHPQKKHIKFKSHTPTGKCASGMVIVEEDVYAKEQPAAANNTASRNAI